MRIVFVRFLMTAVLVMTLFGVTQVFAQSTLLSERPCEGCRLVIDVVAVPGANTDALVAWPSAVTRDGAGRYLAVVPDHEDGILILSGDGRSARSLGREGRGPGEFLRPNFIVSSRDSILVLDPPNARLTILTSELEYARTVSVTPSTTWATQMEGGDLVIAARLSTPAGIGRPLHRLSPDGEVRLSFGADEAPVTPSQPRRSWRVATSRTGSFWIMPYSGEYRVERWNADGRRLQSFVREADWFPRSDGNLDQIPERPPRPRVRGIWQDENGLLWIVINVPASDWESGIGPVHSQEGIQIYSIQDFDRVFDAMVEVVDPRTAAVVFSTRIRNAPGVFVSPGMVARVSEKEDYTFRMEVLRLSLRRPQ